MSDKLRHQINDITECSICTEVFNDPRVLPCVHTFCFECLKSYGKNKPPGSTLQCPLCRKQFTIPVCGWNDLPKNCLAEKLIDINVSDMSSNELIAHKTTELQLYRQNSESNWLQVSQQIAKVEQGIKDRCMVVKNMADLCERELLSELCNIQQQEFMAFQESKQSIEACERKLRDCVAKSSAAQNGEVDNTARSIKAELSKLIVEKKYTANARSLSFQPVVYPIVDHQNILGTLQRSLDPSAEPAKAIEWSPKLLYTSAEGESADGVVGLSVIGGSVYVVRCWTSKVEECDPSTLAVKRVIHVPGLDLPYDMAGCVRRKCLYLTDYGTDVHKVDVGAGGTVQKWKVGEGPNLTVSVSCSTTNVLVTIAAGQKVKEFTSNGSMLREIHLPGDVINPHHALLLSSGHLLVCHGYESDALNRVCCLNADSGEIVNSLSSIEGCSDSRHSLTQPVRLAVDEATGLVFVADFKNDRIVVVNLSTMGYACIIPIGGRSPCGMFSANSVLYVGSWETGQIAVFSLK